MLIDSWYLRTLSSKYQRPRSNVPIVGHSDSLRTGQSGDRIPVGGRDFSHPSRPALEPTQPPIQWVPGLSWGVKRPGRCVKQPPPSSAEVQGRVELYISGPSWPVLGSTFTCKHSTTNSCPETVPLKMKFIQNFNLIT